jgi:hypothetical protein
MKSGFGIIPSVAGNLLESLEQPWRRFILIIRHRSRMICSRHDKRSFVDATSTVNKLIHVGSALPKTSSKLCLATRVVDCRYTSGAVSRPML